MNAKLLPWFQHVAVINSKNCLEEEGVYFILHFDNPPLREVRAGTPARKLELINMDLCCWLVHAQLSHLPRHGASYRGINPPTSVIKRNTHRHGHRPT